LGTQVVYVYPFGFALIIEYADHVVHQIKISLVHQTTYRPAHQLISAKCNI
jgi:hypothetical protein